MLKFTSNQMHFSHRLHVKHVYLETVEKINALFCGKAGVHQISRPVSAFLRISKFLILMNFFSVANIKILKCYSLTNGTPNFQASPFISTVLTKVLFWIYKILQI